MREQGTTRPWRNSAATSPRHGRPALRDCAKAAAILALVMGATTGCGGGDSSNGSHPSRDWKVGDCAGPDNSSSKDSYEGLDCDDPKATIKALEIKDGEFFSAAVQCVPGTDVIISVKVAFGGGDAGGGIPSKTICGRNLSSDHPGDPGAGGGQLVKGDCVDGSAKEVACGGGSGDIKVLDLTKTKEECPAGTDEPMELFPSPGRPYDAICGAKA